MTDNSEILIGLMELNEAKRLKDKLLQTNIEIDLRHNEATCKKGCAVTMEVWALETDIPTIFNVIKSEKNKILEAEGLDIKHDFENQIFDPEKGSTICPACGTEFSTKEKECPECGLVFIPDGME